MPQKKRAASPTDTSASSSKKRQTVVTDDPIERARNVILAYDFPTKVEQNGKTITIVPETEKKFLIALLENSVDPGAIVREIMENAGALESFSLHVWNELFVAFRAAGGRTPVSTPHPTRPTTPSEDSEEEIAALTPVEKAKRDQAALRRAIGDRDNYRCLATDASREFHPTVMAHIIPFSCGNKPDFLRALYRFAPNLGVARLVTGELVNKPYNAVTLSQGIAHEAFSNWSFIIDVEANDVLRIKLLRHYSGWLLRKRQDGTFISIDNQTIVSSRDPPERAINLDLLRVHAALGRILNAAGRAEELERTVEEDDGEGSAGVDMNVVSSKLANLAPKTVVEELEISGKKAE